MSPGQVMVTQDEKAEPIVPLGRMVKTLRCRIEWKGEDGMRRRDSNIGQRRLSTCFQGAGPSAD